MGCGAILDVCHALQVVDPSLYQEGKNLLVRIVVIVILFEIRTLRPYGYYYISIFLNVLQLL
jgi:hypothetical protein